MQIKITHFANSTPTDPYYSVVVTTDEGHRYLSWFAGKLYSESELRELFIRDYGMFDRIDD